MKIQVHDYQNKATALSKALISAGHEAVKSYPDVLLIDVDFEVGSYQRIIKKAFSEGANVCLYSHGAPVITAWDGIWEPSDYIAEYLAQSAGQKLVMEQYGYPYPIHVIGWHYCKQKPFKPAKEVKTVLFAPWHPHSNGWLMPQAKALNTRIYGLLSDMPYQLIVRHVRAVDHNGLIELPEVVFQQSDMSIAGAIEAIDKVDVVVTNMGTLACLAVARGKGLVSYGQDICPHDGYSTEGLRYVDHWDLYRETMRYPFDLSTAKPRAARNILEMAAQVEATDWKQKFIGEPFDPAAFVKHMEANYA